LVITQQQVPEEQAVSAHIAVPLAAVAQIHTVAILGAMVGQARVGQLTY
jgi:hypothetical protein